MARSSDTAGLGVRPVTLRQPCRKTLSLGAQAIKEDELSYVIGKEAATQKKIEKASGRACQTGPTRLSVNYEELH